MSVFNLNLLNSIVVLGQATTQEWVVFCCICHVADICIISRNQDVPLYKESVMEKLKTVVVVSLAIPLLFLFLLLIAIDAFCEGLILLLILVAGAIKSGTFPVLWNPIGSVAKKDKEE